MIMGSYGTPASQSGQVYYDAAKGQYYTLPAPTGSFMIDAANQNPRNRVYIGAGNTPGLFGANGAPVNTPRPSLTPRASLGPSIQSIYGGSVQPQTNPYPGGSTPPRPSFLPQFDMNAVLARASMANPTQAPQRPSFMAMPSMNMAPQQPVGNPNAGIAALPNMTQGK